MIELIHPILIERHITVATAESCTGGALSAAFVSQAGASSYFQGSIVAYTNSAKETLLHVEPKIINDFGAVSEEVTELMAKNVRQLFKAECGIAVSGILGPAGGTPEKPVGTVCVTVSLLDLEPLSNTFHFTGSRNEILEQAVQGALELLALQIKSHL